MNSSSSTELYRAILYRDMSKAFIWTGGQWIFMYLKIVVNQPIIRQINSSYRSDEYA